MVRLQVRGVDHKSLRCAMLTRQTGKYLLENSASAPTHKPIVEGLVGAVALRRIFPFQPVADHVNDPANNPPIVNPWLTVRSGKMRSDARHLLIGQRKQLSHGGHLRQSQNHAASSRVKKLMGPDPRLACTSRMHWNIVSLSRPNIVTWAASACLFPHNHQPQ